MIKRVIAFAGSNNKLSINKTLVVYTANKLTNVEVEVLDLNDFPMPIYGIDEEEEKGIPSAAHQLLKHIQSANGIVLSLAEHNGAYTTAFKNVFDWMSRIDGKLWKNIPMLLMATSPGGRGGSSVLGMAKSRFSYMGGNIVSEFSLPFFDQHFSDNQIVDKALESKLSKAVVLFLEHV